MFVSGLVKTFLGPCQRDNGSTPPQSIASELVKQQLAKFQRTRNKQMKNSSKLNRNILFNTLEFR